MSGVSMAMLEAVGFIYGLLDKS